MPNSSRLFFQDAGFPTATVFKRPLLLITDEIAESTELSYRYPYSSPTKADVDDGKGQLFPELITAAEARARYNRYPLVKVIVNDVAEDALRNGFKIQKIEPGMRKSDYNEQFDRQFQKVYNDLVFAGFLRALKLSRLDGRSALYLAYGDKGFSELTEPPESKRFQSKIKWTYALSTDDFEVSVTETIPRKVDNIVLREGDSDGEIIHPTRFIYFENESMADDRLGQSVLSPIWDLLTVKKHATWSIGQDLWRGSSGLIVVTMPPGSGAGDATAVLSALDNINAKTRTVIPAGSKVDNLASRGSMHVKASYDLIVGQIAASTQIPSFLLQPTKMRIKDKGLDQQYAGFILSIQRSFLTPLLRQCFNKLQETNQLPEGDFNILWVPQSESQREEATTKYLNVLSEKMEGEEKEKRRLEAAKAVEGSKVEVNPIGAGGTES